MIYSNEKNSLNCLFGKKDIYTTVIEGKIPQNKWVLSSINASICILGITPASYPKNQSKNPYNKGLIYKRNTLFLNKEFLKCI